MTNLVSLVLYQAALSKMLTKGTTEKNLKLMLRFAKPHRFKIAMAFVFLVLNGLLRLPVPFLTIYLIDSVIPNKDVSKLLYLSLLILMMSVIFILSDLARSYYLFVSSKMVAVNIQMNLLEHIQKLPISYFNKKDTGYIMARFVDDAALLNNLVTEILVNFLHNFVIFLIGAIAIFYIHWKLALVSLIILPFFILSSVFHGTYLRSLNKTVQEKRAFVTSSLQETLSGIFVVKAFSLGRTELLRVFRHFKETIHAEVKTFFITSRISLIVSVLGALGPLIVLGYGGSEIINNRLTLGELMAFNSVLGYLYGPGQALAAIFVVTQRSLGALERVVEMLELKPEPGLEKDNKDDAAQKILPTPVKGHILFDNISFGYRFDRQILKGINIEIEESSKVAIVGGSGAGKSTLANLLLRFYDPQEGSIYIDGHDIKELDLNSVRQHIGIVSQEAFLFNTSITENIRFGKRSASRDEIVYAAELANAHDFIVGLSEGYETVVGRMGYQLSAGQRQRIALARAILKDPRILILDEATSSVDSQSEELIWRALGPFMVNRTTLLISHRLSSVLQADYIVLLHQGEIISTGKHEDLMNEAVYFELYKEQFYSDSRRKALC